MNDLDSMRRLVADAILAPSSHNTQPWRFRLTPSQIELHADRTRALAVNDPHDRELTISCAAALFNLRVSAAALGMNPEVAIVPEAIDPDQLARLVFPSQSVADTELAALKPCIAKRRTYRRRFAERRVAQQGVEAIVAAAYAEGANFVVQDGANHRRDLATIIGDADAELWDSPSWRRELAAWMHPRRQGDGLTVTAIAAPIAQAIVRTFDLGEGIAARDRDISEQSPLLAVLCTHGDDVLDWITAGQALERALLIGVQHGLQASYLNQPLAIPEFRSRLRTDLDLHGVPQIIMRLGIPVDELPPSPRRALDEVIDPHHG